MPIIAHQCLNGHQHDAYYHHADDVGTRTILCQLCRESMARIACYGTPILYFEEGRGRWIENMGDKPEWITSHAQHNRRMKELGVQLAGTKRGMPSQWV